MIRQMLFVAVIAVSSTALAEDPKPEKVKFKEMLSGTSTGDLPGDGMIETKWATLLRNALHAKEDKGIKHHTLVYCQAPDTNAKALHVKTVLKTGNDIDVQWTTEKGGSATTGRAYSVVDIDRDSKAGGWVNCKPVPPPAPKTASAKPAAAKK